LFTFWFGWDKKDHKKMISLNGQTLTLYFTVAHYYPTSEYLLQCAKWNKLLSMQLSNKTKFQTFPENLNILMYHHVYNIY
jgi:hypothetical protein